MSYIMEITSEDQFTEVTRLAPSNKLLVLYFYTSWAAPCAQMSKVFDALANANPEFSFLSIDADAQANIAELFEVASVPHFILIQDSVILKEVSGADPKEIASALADFKSGKLGETNNDTNSNNDNSNYVPATTPVPATTAPAKEKEASGARTQETEEELNERLEKLTKAAPIMVFIKGTPSEPKCGFSRQLIAILREHQAKFGFFDILKDNAVRQGLKAFSDWPTFPQLYINGEFQGGLDIVKESLEEDADFFNNTLNA
ncbi:monothiol glutaredoxin [Saccharomycopsis crataegensis]|uniref:Monothiol glutaredoxin n=1 Tax=Saccharomycopsis crataegensis TaxID=43959 RepID=A0AAV5QX73_9ASCO|nr:monothiol glutaredoxin [Saccharomycopsis crataegensis]